MTKFYFYLRGGNYSMANQPTKYSKFLVGAASAALVASAVAPVASAADFKDVKGNTHEEGINALADAGVISGYPDGSFKPNQTLTRSDVVKLLGKWLVAEGAEIPADAVSNPRFTDLKSTSNKELLEYAAVVKDNGVFIGSNGRLLAADNITRENMAVVIVRAFDNVKGIDLVTYVNGLDFKADVKDLKSAKSEAQGAINVLDFFDITNPTVANFNPKGSTTRGHFATFLNKSINTDFSEVTGAVVAAGNIKAVNATTVEVTFKDAVENLNSLNFTIEGLTVSNAAVKQTDNKVVVLTTAVQEGGKEYTVSQDSKEIGKFTGLSAVIPTKISITTPSVQGKVGAQAILSADVGVKQAGIPVTFNVKADTLVTLNKDQVFEAITNAEGIATFSYTQYAAGNDAVVAYPTGAPAVRDLGYVFWGVDTILAIDELTTDKVVNNGANKTYKVTYKNSNTGKPEANRTFNVSFKENLNVNADKLANATINGVAVAQLNNSSAPKVATITTDSKGEATFTVSGTNTEVTPVVFAQNLVNNVASADTTKFTYQASLLQAQAEKVKFEAIQAAYTIEVTRDGGEVAAVKADNGRKYNIIVKDKDGKLAKNEVVNVAFNEDLDRVIATVTDAKFVKVNSNGSQEYYTTDANGNSAKKISVTTNAKGEASFVIGSDKVNDYATPVAWIDVNSPNAVDGSLDEGEPKTVAAISYFENAYLDGSALKSFTEAGVETEEFTGLETAVFKANLVNQSGKKFVGTSVRTVTYSVTNNGPNSITVEGQIVSPNRSHSVTLSGATTDLKVQSIDDKTTSVTVVATGVGVYEGKDYAFTAKSATAKFTSTTDIANTYTGIVASVSTKGLTFVGKAEEKFEKSTKFFGGNGAEIFTAQRFVDEVMSLKGDVYVTYIKDADGNKTFKIVRGSASGDTTVINGDFVAAQKALQDSYDAVNLGDYTAANEPAVTAALAAADAVLALPGVTIDELKAGKAALDNALKGIAKKAVATTYGITTTASVVSAGASATQDTLTITFTSALAGFDFDTTSLVTTATKGSKAEVVNGTAGQLVLTVAKNAVGSEAVDLTVKTDDVFTFETKVVSDAYLTETVIITVENKSGSAWTATAKKK